MQILATSNPAERRVAGTGAKHHYETSQFQPVHTHLHCYPVSAPRAFPEMPEVQADLLREAGSATTTVCFRIATAP